MSPHVLATWPDPDAGGSAFAEVTPSVAVVPEEEADILRRVGGGHRLRSHADLSLAHGLVRRGLLRRGPLRLSDAGRAALGRAG